jgi:hypothetical protein
MNPARYDITINQRATFRERIKLPFNATGYTVVAQVWSKRREELLLNFTINWVNRALGEFDMYASRSSTRAMTKSGEWDLLVIEPSGDGFYWLEGTATLDPGLSDTQ